MSVSMTAIKSTRSRCPVCRAEIDAQIREDAGRVVMHKRCPTHGSFEVVLANDPRFYYVARGQSQNAAPCCAGSGCCSPAPTTAPAHDGADTSQSSTNLDPFEKLSTCVALIEIVDSCNLTCPACFAASPWGVGDHVDCTPFDDIVRRVEGVLRRKGFIDILQFSGGEPTIHPDFFRLLDWVLDQKDIGYLTINTNGVRLAGDAAFREQLASRRRARGKFELYQQFDGPQEAGQVHLRGTDLREVRRKAVDECGKVGIPSTLAMVVTPDTLPGVGDAVRWGLQRPHVRGITFQPMFRSGRVPEPTARRAKGGTGGKGGKGGDVALRILDANSPESMLAAITGRNTAGTPIANTSAPISVGDVIHAVCEQAPELLTFEDFTPLPCGDPNCHTIGYLLRTPQGVKPVSKLIDLPSMQGFLRNRVDYRLEDLVQCGCESEPLGAVLKSLEISPEAPFRIFIKPFMDAWTFDQDRIDRCCTHVIRRDGSLDSFCRYYLNGGASA